jgi:hypothetical protein
MNVLPLITALLAALTATASVGALAQSQATEPEQSAASQAQTPTIAEPKIYHPGGPRHDPRAHESAVKARARGQTTAEPRFHPGGRHDQAAHEAALRARRASEGAPK